MGSPSTITTGKMNFADSRTSNRRPLSIIWENYRDRIEQLYLAGHTQTEIRQILHTQYGFDIKPKQLEYRLKIWGLRKNIKQAEYDRIQEDLQSQPGSRQANNDNNAIVYLGRSPVPPEKLQRNLSRYISGSKRKRPEVANGRTSLTPNTNAKARASLDHQNQTTSPRITTLESVDQQAQGQRHKRRRISLSTPSSESEDDICSQNLEPPETSTRSLACPYAKALPQEYESCIPIRRQDLAGVKEHLKRKHFNLDLALSNQLNNGIRNLKTWDEVFFYAFPNWTGPKPSAEFNMFNICRGITLSPVALTPHGALSPQTQVSSSPPVEGDTGMEVRENLESENIAPSRFVNRGDHSISESDLNDLALLKKAQAITCTPNLDLDRLKDLIETVRRHRSATHEIPEPSRRLEDAGGETNPVVRTAPQIPSSAETDTSVREGENLSSKPLAKSLGYLRHPSENIETEVGSNLQSNNLRNRDFLGSYAPKPSALGNQEIHELPKTKQNLSSIQHQIPQVSTLTPSIDKSGKYLLRVARDPARNSNLETSGHKKLYFDSFEDFEVKFEPWMRHYFRDPLFNWDKWVLKDGRRGILMSSVVEVREELEFTMDALGITSTGLYLIPKW